jgi:hypothetical protein
LPLDLKQLIDTHASDDGVWFEFTDVSGVPSGFHVKIAYYGKQVMEKIYRQTRIRVTNLRTLAQETDIDQNKFKQVYADMVVRDWRGLTVAVLKNFVPVKNLSLNGQGNEELACTTENKQLLIGASTVFDQWVANIASDVARFQAEQKEEEIKN